MKPQNNINFSFYYTLSRYFLIYGLVHTKRKYSSIVICIHMHAYTLSKTQWYERKTHSNSCIDNINIDVMVLIKTPILYRIGIDILLISHKSTIHRKHPIAKWFIQTYTHGNHNHHQHIYAVYFILHISLIKTMNITLSWYQFSF